MKRLAVLVLLIGWQDLWSTPDQRGQRLMEAGRYAEAAAQFADPMWRGVAQFRAGDFKTAAETFGGMDTADAAYDQGTALIMLGKYDDAIQRFDRALALRPGWADAQANRTLATVRAAKVKQTGGDTGDQEQTADQIVYDKTKKGGLDTKIDGAAVMSDQSVRAMWLKRIEPRPAEFLRSRFLFQLEQKP
jgi:Ca-activated chloride channel family protein